MSKPSLNNYKIFPIIICNNIPYQTLLDMVPYIRE